MYSICGSSVLAVSIIKDESQTLGVDQHICPNVLAIRRAALRIASRSPGATFSYSQSCSTNKEIWHLEAIRRAAISQSQHSALLRMGRSPPWRGMRCGFLCGGTNWRSRMCFLGYILLLSLK